MIPQSAVIPRRRQMSVMPERDAELMLHASPQRSPDSQPKPLLASLMHPLGKLFLLLPACAAVIGFAIHASLLFKPNFAGIVYPQSRGILLTLSLLFFCLTGLLLQYRFHLLKHVQLALFHCQQPPPHPFTATLPCPMPKQVAP